MSYLIKSLPVPYLGLWQILVTNDLGPFNTNEPFGRS